MTRSLPSSTHDRRSSAARLVRLTITALFAVAVVGSAIVWAQTTNNLCIHNSVQQRVLQSVVQDQHSGSGTHSAVGLPYVAIVDSPTGMSTAVDSMGSDITPPNVTRSEHWGELRITVSTDNFTDPQRYCKSVGEKVKDQSGFNVTCTTDDILTEDKRDILMKSILPEAVRLHTDRLKVKQVRSNWTVRDELCVNFKVPQTRLTEGFNNTDFLLYVEAVPSDSGVVAWGAICQAFPGGQPAVGVINVPAASIVSRYDQRVIRTVAHQIAHALGFSDKVFVSTGIKNSSSPIRYNPLTPPVIKGNTTVAKARDHYNCSSLKQLEMESDPLDESKIFHFLRRNAKDELMAPVVGAGYYSALTMAIFEDMGFYKANFSKAEAMPWGHSATCAFLNNTCKDNIITQWPKMFCNRTIPEYSCTSSRLDIGVCVVDTHHPPMATAYRYFPMTELEENSPSLDSCPYVEAKRTGACNRNSSTASDDFDKFSVFSDAARCIDGAFTPKNTSKDSRRISGMCTNVKCDNATNTYSIQVKGSRSYVNCTPGMKVTLSNVSNAFEASGYITCPPYVEVCQGNVKAVMDFERDREHSASSSSGGDTASSSGSDVRPSSSSSGSDSSHSRGNSAAGVHNARAFLPGIAAVVAVILIGLSCA